MARRSFLRIAARLPLGAIVLSPAGLPAAPVGAGPGGHWEKLPYPPGRIDNIRDVALDERDRLWVMSTGGLHYWDGEQYQIPVGKAWASGAIPFQFFGGADRGLFFARIFTRSDLSEGDKRYGEVYRLSDGRIELFADFHDDTRRSNPNFYVSANGRLFHWGAGFLAFHTGSDWERIEAELEPSYVRVVEVGRRVHFLSLRDQFVTIGAEGRIDQGTLGPQAELWRQVQAIAAIRSVDSVPHDEAKMSLPVVKELLDDGMCRGSRIVVLPARDGAVWLAASVRPPGIAVRRIEVDGTVTRKEHTADLLHAMPLDVKPTSVLSATDGHLWVGLSSGGTVRLNGDDRTLIDSRTGLQLSGPTMEDSRGNLYSGLYVFHPERAGTTGQRPVVPRPLLPEYAWTWKPEDRQKLQHAWQIGTWLVTLPRNFNRTNLFVLDPLTGQVVNEIRVDTNGCSQVWAVPGSGPAEMLFVYPNHVLAINLPVGTVRGQTEYPLNFRIAPTAIGNRYLVANPANLALVERSGEEVWKHRWRSSVGTKHLAVFGSVAVAQSRSGTTVGIDLHSGEELWSDRTDAWRGDGAAFGDDARYVVEANTWLTPQTAESGLLARDPRSGRRLWEYRQPGMLRHTPVVHRGSDRVLAVFDRGNAVCLAGADGAEVWNKYLPETPHRPGGEAHDRPYWPAISIQDDRLWIVDCNGALQVLDLDDGRLVTSILLTTALSKDGSLPVATSMVNMPWRASDVLVAATELGVVAYRLPKTLQDGRG